MGRYRKRPVVIEAMQYHRLRNGVELVEFVGTAVHVSVSGTFIIHTLEGDMTVDDGDWIIRGVKGEFYPCKPDIFEATYEPVEVEDKP